MANTVAYGFTTIRDRFQDKVTEVGIDVVYTAIQESFAEYNREVNAALRFLSEPTTLRAERIWLPGDGIMQPVANNANPDPQRVTGSYEVGYPVRGYGSAFGADHVEAAKQTVADANRWTMNMMEGDLKRLRREMLKALLYNVGTDGWTFTDQPNATDPSVVVRSLANADSVTYVMTGGSAGTDSHYLTQSGTITTTDDLFSDIYDELAEHPSNNVSMGGHVVTFVPTSQKTAVGAMSNLNEPKNDLIIPGISSDRVLDTIYSMIPFGDSVIGEIDGNLLIEWKALPDDIFLSVAPNAAVPPLKQREEPEATLQGLYSYTVDIDGNNKMMVSRRLTGFGVANRVAAVCYYIGNASYQNPTGYDPTSAE